MSYEFIKCCSQRIGLYRSARWVNRHVLNRTELREFNDELAFYAQFIKKDYLCFDVGANYGWKSEVFLHLGAKVIAFEPQPECVRELKARLLPHPQLSIELTALGSSPGQTKLYIMEHRTKSSILKELSGDNIGSIDVPISTLDKMIEKYGMPKFCKIDVEGYELEVLKGLTQPIPKISFEYHTKQNGQARAIECLKYLAGFGELSINVCPAEKPFVAAHRAWNMSDFLDFFNKYIPNLKGYEYGDIIVELSNS